jgi:hypothetical protein
VSLGGSKNSTTSPLSFPLLFLQGAQQSHMSKLSVVSVDSLYGPLEHTLQRTPLRFVFRLLVGKECDGRPVQRAGQEVNHRIHQRLHTLCVRVCVCVCVCVCM